MLAQFLHQRLVFREAGHDVERQRLLPPRNRSRASPLPGHSHTSSDWGSEAEPRATSPIVILGARPGPRGLAGLGWARKPAVPNGWSRPNPRNSPQSAGANTPTRRNAGCFSCPLMAKGQNQSRSRKIFNLFKTIHLTTTTPNFLHIACYSE